MVGGLFVFLFTRTQNRWRIDDVLGVWPLHGMGGAWGGIAGGIFGSGLRAARVCRVRSAPVARAAPR